MRSNTETVRHDHADRAVTPTTAQMPERGMWRQIGSGLMLALLVLAPGIAIALNLATTPLFLTTNGKGNIVFIGDDSESMDWGLVTSDTDGVMTVGNCTYYYAHPGAGASTDAPAKNITGYDGTNYPHGSIVPSEEFLSGLGFWRAWNKDYNKLYYDPSVTYSPWSGADDGGTAFTAANASAAYYNPYRTSHGSIDLTARTSYKTKYHATNCASGNMTVTNFLPARYYTWDSGTSDGVVDASDGHTLVEITSGSTYTKASTRTDCANSTYCTYAEEIQNFANWFSYYRKRDLTMKAAISSVVEDSLDRIAYTVLNDTSSSAINISILTMNSSATSGNKRTLLKGLYSTIPNGSSTPLRYRLDAVGRYFECVAGNAFGLAAGDANCPIQTAASGGACQQNFAVMVTDGGWTDDFNDSTYAVGNTDYAAASGYDGGNYKDAADGVSNTLADIAMHYYERDLSTLSDQVPTLTGVDTASHQHMVTYALAIGLSGTCTSDSACAGAWPSVAVTSSDSLKIDDLRHAAYNGRGSFLSAYTPDALVTALTTAMSGVTGRTASAAAVAVNSRSLSTSTRLYQARFNSEEWSGDLRALSIDADGTVNLTTPEWSAAEQLESQDWDSGRTIITRNASRGIPFRWTETGDNALTTTQMTALKTNSSGGTDAASVGEARLKWLRGDTSNEGTGASNFRVRTGGFKLGDIVNSTPVFVGAPPALPNLETTAHSTFRTSVVNRPERIYVGANDGMLHGFDASTGQEKLAYLPTAVFNNNNDNDNLSRLTFPSGYTHRFYVDGTPTAGDAYAVFTNVSGICSTGCWRTVLVGGMGGGGKGLYALDVTDPDGTKVNTNLSFSSETNNAQEISLWEFTASGDEVNDVGYIFGQPTITKLHNDKWGVITGNGYNSANGKAILYILDIKDGSVIKKIDLGGTSNGLSTPAVVDTNSDYIADYVFAGDLNGNMWKIDITSSSTNSWKSDYLSGSTAVPLYTAVAANGSSQVITERPEIGNHPTGEDGYMVYFGTGRYLDSDDKNPSSAPVNTFYGIWDRGDVSQISRDKLLTQTISTATVSSTTVRVVTNNPIGWCTASNVSTCSCPTDGSTGTCLGWKDDLLTSASDSLGEMSVSNPVMLGGALPRIIFTTLIPQSEACSYGGSSWLMELNPTNGGRLSEAVFDIDGNGTIGSEDKTSEGAMVSGINPGIGIMPEPVILRDPANKRDLKTEPGSTGDIQTIKNYVSGTTGGRQSWRQLR